MQPPLSRLAAALVTGAAGFAFGIVAAAAWLHSLPLAQTTALFVAYGLIVQGVPVWKLRRSIQLSRLLVFLSAGRPGLRGSSSRCGARCEDGGATSNAQFFSRFALFMIGLPLLLVGTWVGISGDFCRSAFGKVAFNQIDQRLGTKPVVSSGVVA